MRTKAKTAEQYAAAFVDNDMQRLLNARRIRREIFDSHEELDVSLGVLAVTGSPELCEVYEAMAAKVETSQGKPLVVVGDYDESYLLTGRVPVMAGIIAGQVMVRSSYYKDRSPEEGPAGHMTLRVPVTSRLSYSSRTVWSQHTVQYPDTDVTTATIADLGNREYENFTTDPSNDFFSNIRPENVLIGMDDITSHETFSRGIGVRDVFLALHGEAPIHPNERG